MRNISALSVNGTNKLNIAIQKSRRRIVHRSANTYLPVILFPQPPQPHMLASVIIPAKNEAENIIKTLDALRNQQDENGAQLSFHLYEILLLANNCTDETHTIALAYQQQHPQFPLYIAEIELEKQNAHIGTVRRLLMDEAFRRHQLNKQDGIILSTDGDTEADARWIINTISEMQNGCDAVGGRILTRQVACDSKLYYLQDTTYRYLSARLEALLDPTSNDSGSCHFQCFGASMAVRCSVYQKAGRLPVLPFLEDEAFSRALHRIDAKVKRSTFVKVYTSSRLHGRVKVGLSAHLAHLGEMKKKSVPQYVESLQTLTEKWKIKRQLHQCWRLRKKDESFASCIHFIANAVGVSPKWLLTEMVVSLYFGEFWEKVEHKMYQGEWKKRQVPVPIEKAIEELRKSLK